MAEKVLMVALSPTMERGVIVNWNKNEGDPVASGDIICEVETDKATMEYESVQEGTLLKIVVPAGKDAAVGEIIAILGQKGEDMSALLTEMPPALTVPGSVKPAKLEQPAKPMISATPEFASGIERPRASPLARRMASEAGVPIGAIVGSGPGGRIIKRDIESMVQKAAAPIAVTAPGVPISGAKDESLPVSQKRRIIAHRLTESKFSAPHYYLKLSVNMDAILTARAALNASSRQKVSMNAFIIKMAAEALKSHPMVNATWKGDSIIKFASIDVGLAVAQPDGLITPVIRHCGDKGIIAIDNELRLLIDRALENKLTPDEYTGATFTISNLGSFGIDEFTAIINPPASAILAVGTIKREPVVNDGDQIQIQSRMRMTLSCDHRIIDGAVGAAFLKDLKEMMENPIRVLF